MFGQKHMYGTDDFKGIRALYPTGVQSVNLAASYMRVSPVRPNTVGLNNPVETREVCPGDIVKIDWSVSSTGNKNPPHYNVGFFLSTNEYISRFDLKTTQYNGAYQSGETDGFYTAYITIPYSVKYNTIYHVGPYVDVDDVAAETREFDNSTPETVKLQILSFSECQ